MTQYVIVALKKMLFIGVVLKHFCSMKREKYIKTETKYINLQIWGQNYICTLWSFTQITNINTIFPEYKFLRRLELRKRIIFCSLKSVSDGDVKNSHGFRIGCMERNYSTYVCGIISPAASPHCNSRPGCKWRKGGFDTPFTA